MDLLQLQWLPRYSVIDSSTVSSVECRVSSVESVGTTELRVAHIEIEGCLVL